MPSSIFLSIANHIHEMGLQSIPPPFPLQKSSSCLITSFSHRPITKREEKHQSNILHPQNSRATFCIWAAARAPQEATVCKEVNARVQETGTHSRYMETFSEHLSVLEGLGLVSKDINLLIKKYPLLLEQSSYSLRRRIQSLEALGVKGEQLIRLLKKQPSVFTTDLGPTLKFLNENIEGFNRERFHRVLFKVDPRLLLSFRAKITLLLKHGVEKSQIGNLLNKANLKVFCERSIENLDEVLVYLKKVKVEKEFWWLVVRYPGLLFLSVERDIIPKIKVLENLLKNEDSVNKLIWRFPRILGYTVELLEGHLEYLNTVFSEEDLVCIVRAFPQILSLSIEKTLKPRIQFLKQCNLKKDEIAKLLIKQPTFLGVSLDENLSKKSALLQKIGFEPESYHFAQALCTVTRISYENLQLTVDLYLSYGLSYEDICIMGTKQPHVLRYSSECMKPKIDYLINNMHFSIKTLISFPAFLGYSLEDRIRPRHEIMKELVSKGLVKEDYSIIRLLAASDKAFIFMVLNEGMMESCIRKWLLV